MKFTSFISLFFFVLFFLFCLKSSWIFFERKKTKVLSFVSFLSVLSIYHLYLLRSMYIKLISY